MDIRRILIILLLLFSAFGDKIDLTKFNLPSIMSKPEVVMPEQKYVDFSKDVAGEISNWQNKMELSVFCDVLADEVKNLELKKPSVSQILDLFYSSFKELHGSKYKDKYPKFSSAVVNIPKSFSEDKDRILSNEEVLEMSWYYRGLAWNILTN